MNLEEVKTRMQKVLEVLRGDLGTIRTGRAAPALVENIVISAYSGSAKMKVMELATIATQDLQTLLITPFDNSIIGEIQKGIQEANVGLNPVIDSQFIRIAIPPLSQERREQLIALMKQKLENGKIMVRQVRHEAMNDVKKPFVDKSLQGKPSLDQEKQFSEDEIKRLEKEVQRETDGAIGDIDALGKRKEQELLAI